MTREEKIIREQKARNAARNHPAVSEGDIEVDPLAPISDQTGADAGDR